MDLTSEFADSAPEPALSHRYLVRFPNAPDEFSAIPESATLTFQKIPAVARFGGGTNFYFPDFNDIDAITVVFYETHDYRCSKWINDWRLKIVDENGCYTEIDNYAVTITIEAYNHLSNDSPVASWEMYVCFPTDQAAFDYNNEDSEGRIKVSVPFSVTSSKRTK